ncbi:hypothetical protein Celaphus_00017324, partial [Cervus elaphus hippelaphus]
PAKKCTIASRIDCFSEVSTSVFGEKLREQVEEPLSFYETGEIPRKNLDVMKGAMVQAEEAAAEITRTLEKQEKKHLKKEKERLAAIALASSENISSDLEETAGTGSLPKWKKSIPKEEPVTDPGESENKRVPKKKRKLSSKEEPLSSGPEEAAVSKSSGSKEKKKL